MINLESSIRGFENEIFRCEQCKFTTESNRGLKVHMTRKHTNLKENKYPQVCDFCDMQEYSSEGMKRHLKSHSFKKIIYKCEDCDFLAPNDLTLEVHAGRVHSGNFECGLCDYTGKNLEKLYLHKKTCETYTCIRCDKTFKNQGDCAVHLKKEHARHAKLTEILIAKLGRENFENVASKTLPGDYLI